MSGTAQAERVLLAVLDCQSVGVGEIRDALDGLKAEPSEEPIANHATQNRIQALERVAAGAALVLETRNRWMDSLDDDLMDDDENYEAHLAAVDALAPLLVELETVSK